MSYSAAPGVQDIRAFCTSVVALTRFAAAAAAAAAIFVDMRQDWARAWADLIAPGGELVTLMFPIGGNPAGAPQNPPWSVTPELYQELLLPAGGLFVGVSACCLQLV